MKRHSLDRAPVVDREKFLVEAARGSVVLHLGCADAPHFRSSSLLHCRLASVAKEIVGVDFDEEGVSFMAKELGFSNIVVGNVEALQDVGLRRKFDLVVAGELLEHLPNPGLCLAGVRDLLTREGSLIITVPNAFSVKGFLRVSRGTEIINPDHVSYYSVVTLQKILEMSGYSMISHAYWSWRSSEWFKRTLDKLVLDPVRVYAPYLSDGVIVVAKVNQ